MWARCRAAVVSPVGGCVIVDGGVVGSVRKRRPSPRPHPLHVCYVPLVRRGTRWMASRPRLRPGGGHVAVGRDRVRRRRCGRVCAAAPTVAAAALSPHPSRPARAPRYETAATALHCGLAAARRVCRRRAGALLSTAVWSGLRGIANGRCGHTHCTSVTSRSCAAVRAGRDGVTRQARGRAAVVLMAGRRVIVDGGVVGSGRLSR
jgi:hypothetical protein